ncbi:hypothetical protein [Streptosporangium sp. NPDC000396]|uniref:hypothetical protein n=1 Tax=Streptosporangium sp. NPDC000396 TaxID=3366185 RepID=UPI00367A3488
MHGRRMVVGAGEESDQVVLRLLHPHPASEDFSRVLAWVPGAFVFLGSRLARLRPDEAEENHSPRAEFDDVVLPDGVRLLAELAARRLRGSGSPLPWSCDPERGIAIGEEGERALWVRV